MPAATRSGRGLVALLLVFALLTATLPARAAVEPQAPPTSQYTVGDCSNIDKNTLRAEIERHALDVIAGSSVPLDIDQVVARKWAELRVDAVIDAAVGNAVDELYNREDYFNRLASGWWGDKAQEYAEQVANTAFSSPAFRSKIEELSAAVGVEVAQQVEAQFAEAASVALLCLQEYVGEQYATTLFSAFEHSVMFETQKLDLSTEGAPEINAVASHQLALAGVGTILVTQLVYRLAQKLSEKIAQRVAGKIVGRILGRVGSSFIPIAGWIIGIGMIVYDLWEGGQGALPQIEEALTSQEVKAKIREEIVTAIKDDLPDQAAWIALETAVSLVEQWQQFCTRYQDVCATADENAMYGDLLDMVTLDELDRLNTLTTYLMNQAGRTTLNEVIVDGQLERLLALPDATLRELMAWSTPTTMLAWQALAGDQLPRLVDYGVHRLAAPAQFTPATLAALLAVPGATEADKLLALTPEQRDLFLKLPADVLHRLVAVEPVADLEWLAGYMALSQEPAQDVAVEIAEGRTSVQALRAPAQVTPVATASSSASVENSASITSTQNGLPAQPVGGTIPALGFLLLGLLLIGGGAGGYWYWRRVVTSERDTGES